MTGVELKQAMRTGWLSVKFCRATQVSPKLLRYHLDRFQRLTRGDWRSRTIGESILRS